MGADIHGRGIVLALDSISRSANGRRHLVLGVALLLVVVALDRLMADRGSFDEWPPDGSWPYVLRAAGLAGASFLIMAGSRFVSRELLPAGADPASTRTITTSTVISLLIGAGSAAILVASPTALSDLVREDQLVEWASTAVSFAAAALLGYTGLLRWRARNGRAGAGWTVAAFCALALVMLFLGMEEVSWFQRQLHIDTPEAFVNANAQQELNLHNFATVASGNAFYVGGFVFCVLVPFLLADRRLPPPLAWLNPVIPSTAVLYSSAIAGAIVYTMWNVIPVQMTFWMSLAAVLLARRTGLGDGPGIVVAVAMVATAAVFLGLGDTMIRDWDDTEVRELSVPFGFLVYGIETASAARKGSLRPASTTSTTQHGAPQHRSGETSGRARSIRSRPR